MLPDEVRRAWADRCGLAWDESDDRVREPEKYGWPQDFEVFYAGWKSAYINAEARGPVSPALSFTGDVQGRSRASFAPSAVAVATMTMGGAEKSDIPARVSRVCPTSAPERQETQPSPANLANKIEKLAAEATPGPWAWDQRGEKINEWALGTAFDKDEKQLAGRFTDEDAIYDEYVCSHEAATCNYKDPALICELRNNLPAIIAALRSAPSTDGGNDRSSIIEECAKVAEREADACQPGSPAEHQNWPAALMACALRIRALKGKS